MSQFNNQNDNRWGNDNQWSNNQWSSPSPPPPVIRQRQPSCMPFILITLLVFAMIGGAVFFIVQKASDQIDTALESVDQAFEQVTAEAQASSASAPTPGSSRSDIDLSYQAIATVPDQNGDEHGELLVHVWTNQRTGYGLALLDGAAASELWQVPLPSIEPRFFVGYQDVIIGVKDRDIIALDTGAGRTLWEHKLSDDVLDWDRTPQVWQHNGQIIVHTKDNVLTAFDSSSGAQTRQVTLRALNASKMIRINDQICDEEFTEELRNHLQCYTLDSFEPGQVYALDSESSYSVYWWPLGPQSSDGGIYRVDLGDVPQLQRLSADGTVAWFQDLPSDFQTIIQSEVTLVDSADTVALGIDDKLSIVGPERSVNISVPESELYPLAIDGDLVYVARVRQRGTPYITIDAVSLADGSVRWSTPELGEFSGTWSYQDSLDWAVVPGQGIALSWDIDDDSEVFVRFYDQSGKQVWEERTSETGSTSAPRLTRLNRQLLIESDRSVQLVDATTGDSAWRLNR